MHLFQQAVCAAKAHNIFVICREKVVGRSNGTDMCIHAVPASPNLSLWHSLWMRLRKSLRCWSRPDLHCRNGQGHGGNRAVLRPPFPAPRQSSASPDQQSLQVTHTSTFWVQAARWLMEAYHWELRWGTMQCECLPGACMIEYVAIQPQS